MADDDKTYTQAELETLIEEAKAAGKAETDKSYGKLWTEAKQIKQALKELGGLDDVKARLERLRELETETEAGKRGITAEEMKKIRTEIRADVEREFNPFKQEAETLRSENRKLKLDDRVKGLLAKSGARPERIDALFTLTANEFDLTDDGEPMIRDRAGASVEKYIQDEVAKQYPELFTGSGSKGGGASKSAGGAGGSGTKRIEAGDTKAWNDNLADIASGKIEVVLPG